MAILNQKRILNLIPKISAPVTLHVSQGDVGTTIEFTLVKGDELFVNPGNVSASVHGVREDGANFGAFTCTLSGSTVSFPLHSEMTAVKGSALAEIVIVDNDGNKVGSANFAILVEESVFPLGVTYDNDVSVYESILAYVQTIPAQVQGEIADVENDVNSLNEALASEVTARENAISTEVTNRNAAIAVETANRESADTTINARIDQIIAPSGEAPSAAEVADARIGVTGKIYPNLGTAIRTQINNIFDVLSNFNFSTIPYSLEPNEEKSGIVWSTLEHGRISAVGRTTSTSNAENLFYFTSLPIGKLKAGCKVLLYQDSTDDHSLYMELYTKKTGGSLTIAKAFYGLNGFTTWAIPTDVEQILWRAYAIPNADINANMLASIVLIPDNNSYYPITNEDSIIGYNEFSTGWGGNDVDLNNILDNSFNLLTDTGTYLNAPSNFTEGFLQSITTGKWHLQLLYSFNGGVIYKRRGTPNGQTWEDWQTLSNNTHVTNNYSFPEYSQTLNVTASPTITTDTNNFLASTNDTTDRTADILTMLQTTKACHLGTGVFYVSNLQMPEGSMLCGEGHNTIIRLAGDSDGYAVKLGTQCCIKDLQIRGSNDPFTVPSVIGGRHGILWQGNYTEEQSSLAAPYRSIISNVWIYNFTGGGITCYDTGFGSTNALLVNNVWITSCCVGLNIAYWSEFNKFENVSCKWCYYGCINNGGNNIFIGCDFSNNNELGMLMDNSQGQSPNNSHGSCVGCVFNHTAHNGTDNTGIGIKILNCPNGFSFTGCQIFFSQIYLDDSDGIVFDACNFGYNNCDITIKDGGAILFANCMFQNKPPIAISDNNKVHFANCYNRSTGAAINA